MDLLLPHAELAYKEAPTKATGVSAFKVVYGIDPFSPSNLSPRPLDQKPSSDGAQRVKGIQKLHEQVCSKITESNLSFQGHANKRKKPKIFQPGEMIRLRKESFPTKRKSKLMPRVDGPFDNSEKLMIMLKVDLPRDYGMLTAFNIADLSPYLEDDYLVNLRSNFSKQGEDDGPSSQSNEHPQNSSSNRISQVQAQEFLKILQMHSTGDHRFDSSHVLHFVHVISQAIWRPKLMFFGWYVG